MTPQRLRRVEQIFASLIADDDDEKHHEPRGAADPSTSPAARIDTLCSRAEALCDGDQSLCLEVQSLLRHHFEADTSSSTGRADGAMTQPLSSSRGRGRFLDPDELRGLRGERAGLGSHELLSEWANAGTRIGGYTIIGQLGAGGMGVVYVAEQARPRRTVALKLVRHGLATPALIRRFEREAEVLGRLCHPGIAQIFEAGVAELDVLTHTIRLDDQADHSAELSHASRQMVPFIAMELVRGPNILDYVRIANPSARNCLELIAAVCDAVEHAHQRGVIHRDLKPQNILVAPGASLDAPPQPKVLDFGVARAIDPGDQNDAPAESRGITREGQMIGTLAYMSPEQIAGASRDIDTRADVYALGAILYHLLAGRAPFDASTRSIPELARAICHEEPPMLGKLSRAHRGDIETIVAKAMAKDRQRRYQSAAELRDDIRRHLRSEPISAKQDSALYVIGKRIKRHRAFVGVAAAALVGLAALVVYSTIQQHRQEAVANDAISQATHLADELSETHLDQARLLAQAGDFVHAEEILWREQLLHPQHPLLRDALRALYRRYPLRRTILGIKDQPTVQSWIPATGAAHWVRFSPDGARIALAARNGAWRIWDVQPGDADPDQCIAGQIEYQIAIHQQQLPHNLDIAAVRNSLHVTR